jgi:hypothetical protein
MLFLSLKYLEYAIDSIECFWTKNNLILQKFMFDKFLVLLNKYRIVL